MYWTKSLELRKISKPAWRLGRLSLNEKKQLKRKLWKQQNLSCLDWKNSSNMSYFQFCSSIFVLSLASKLELIFQTRKKNLNSVVNGLQHCPWLETSRLQRLSHVSDTACYLNIALRMLAVAPSDNILRAICFDDDCLDFLPLWQIIKSNIT